MADFEMKEGTFNLFKNDKKEGNQPDYTGKVVINGVEMRTAAWIKQKDGKAYFTGKISEFQKRSEENTPVVDPLNPPAADFLSAPDPEAGMSAKEKVISRNKQKEAESPTVADDLPF